MTHDLGQIREPSFHVGLTHGKPGGAERGLEPEDRQR
jgi:hypothetical protein